MISDGRAGGVSQSECLCRYRVANAILNDDLKAQLFDAWYIGDNNMTKMERLPNQSRVREPLRTMQKLLQPNCG
ncbi:MAG: hypothetical protein MK098_08205 [Marinovum sp.]|nr:hypothetical protein [Marinovum sp.]